MLRVNTKPRKRNAPRPAHKSATSYLKWLRGRQCACKGMNPHCGGRMIAAHVDYAAKGTRQAKGMASKVADQWAIPLSDLCHQLQHDKGWPWFDFNILRSAGAGAVMAEAYWHAWPGRLRWELENSL